MQTTLAPPSQGALSRLEGKLKFRYLGIGFIWAWIYGSFETFAVYPERMGVGINADASWIASATVVVLALFVTGFVLGRRSAPPRWLAIGAALFAALGTLLSALGAHDDLLSVIIVSGILTGIGTGVLYVLWGHALAQLDVESAELAIPAASLIMLTCALVLPYLPSAIGIAATASLPVASGVMLLLTYRDVFPAQNSEDDSDSAAPHGASVPNDSAGSLDADAAPASIPSAAATASDRLATCSPSRAPRPSLATFATFARISGLLFLAYFVTGCSGAIQGLSLSTPFNAWGIDFPTLIGSCCGIALMVCFVLFTARPSFDALFRLIAPLLVMATALMPWADLWTIFLSSTFVAITDTTLTIAAVLFVITAAKRGTVNAAVGVGVTQGFLQLGVLAGNTVGSALSDVVTASPTGLFSVTLGILAFFSLAWFIYPANRTLLRPARPDGARPSGRAPGTVIYGITSLGATETPTLDIRHAAIQNTSEPSLDQACRTLAQTHGLSAREEEILGYLARGRSQPYIREELVLSKNTVATHVKHIYQKLNVHSRQELIDLFE